jgi:hypothetical protein
MGLARASGGKVNNVNYAHKVIPLNHMFIHCVVNNRGQDEQSRWHQPALFTLFTVVPSRMNK